MPLSKVALALVSFVSVNAHLALWHPSMYGYDPNDPNQSEPVLPLMHLPFSEWWFHGYINKPPVSNTFLNLPAGGTLHAEIACNKALTTLGAVPAQQTGIYACDGDGPTGGIGAMHTSDNWGTPFDQIKDVKGTAIAIVYKSDVNQIKPEDFVVVSTNYSSPWFKKVEYQIPNDLPACPEGGCHCMWGWIHADDAGSEQMYMIGYRCQVTGATYTTPLPAPKTANKCNYPVDTSNCTVGAKQPHYWYQAEGNNNPQGQYDPPFYNGAYGFMNGAQTDLFAGTNIVPVAGQSPSSATTTTISSSTTAPTNTKPATVQSSAPSNNGAVALVSSSSSSSAPTTTTSTTTIQQSPNSSSTGAKNLCRTKQRRRSLNGKMKSEVRRHVDRSKQRALIRR